MRHQVLGLLLLITATQINAQSDEDLIRHSIQNYFNGTAYNYLDQIESAFHPEANLFLENQAGELVIFTATDYIALFKKNEPGTFGGRYSKILNIDIEGNLAQVKAEILIPKRKRRYVDVFIMRKNKDNQWQIIGKAANSSVMD